MTAPALAAAAVVSAGLLAAACWAVGAHVPVRNRVRQWRRGGWIA